MDSLEYFHRDVGSSQGPPQPRVDAPRAVAMPCDWSRGTRRGPWPRRRPPTCSGRYPMASASPQDLPLRKTIAASADNSSDPSGNASAAIQNTPAPSRIGQVPTYGVARRQRRLRHRLRLAQSHPQEAEAPSGRGAAEAAARTRQSRAVAAAGRRRRIVAVVDPAVGACQQGTAAAGDGRHGRGPATAQTAQGR